jgi:pimeloyl-ACP methyl ester carboxylesterase
MGFGRTATSGLVLAGFWSVAIADSSDIDGGLRRRAMFGAQLAPVTREVRDRQGLDGDGGVVLEKTFPGTSAADGDFRAGDMILAIDGAGITGIPMFLQKVEEARAGDALVLDLVRDGARMQKRVTLKEKPREKGAGFDVLYGAVNSRGARLRTIVTRPKAGGRHSAVMLLQGYGCGSIDQPVGQTYYLTWLAHGLARHGYVTMRVDRPSCGDSEGGPCRDVDFETEIDGYREALRALKRLDFVDAGKVFLFGHSLGGSMGPIIAVDEPVRGIAVFGSGSETWFEGILGQRRRIAALDGTRPADVDRRLLGEARFWYALLVEKKTPTEILEHFPELKKFGTTIGNTFEPMVADDKYVGGRHYRFHHQAADKNLAEVWTRVAATRVSSTPGAPARDSHPHVLVMWGKSDWHVSREANAWIAEIVNRETPGNASFVTLDATDHFFYRAATPEESFRNFIPARGAPAREFNPDILEVLRRWLDETAKRVEKPPEDRPASRDGDRFTGMDSYIRAAMEKWQVPGLAIAVVKDDEVVLARGYGVRELGKDRKVTTDTAFPLASCWKSFQAAAVGLLVTEGKLRWDDPVARHLPDFEVSDPYLTGHDTLRDL